MWKKIMDHSNIWQVIHINEFYSDCIVEIQFDASLSRAPHWVSSKSSKVQQFKRIKIFCVVLVKILKKFSCRNKMITQPILACLLGSSRVIFACRNLFFLCCSILNRNTSGPVLFKNNLFMSQGFKFNNTII